MALHRGAQLVDEVQCGLGGELVGVDGEELAEVLGEAVRGGGRDRGRLGRA
jgi:hypothetical protein